MADSTANALVIRQATIADYDALCRVLDAGDALHRERLPNVFQKPEGPVRQRDYIIELIDDPNAGLFVAEREGHLLGALNVLLRTAPDIPLLVPRRYAVVDNVVVHRSARRTGIGRALMDAAHRWAREHGLDTVELNVFEFNQEAIQFYENLGYETVSRKMTKRL
jgi:GNAT superfamily N-acetyltransferase